MGLTNRAEFGTIPSHAIDRQHYSRHTKDQTTGAIMSYVKRVETIAAIKAHSDDLQRLKGVLEKFALEQSPIARQHLVKSLLGWHQRLNYTYWNVVATFNELINEIDGGDHNGTTQS